MICIFGHLSSAFSECDHAWLWNLLYWNTICFWKSDLFIYIYVSGQESTLPSASIYLDNQLHHLHLYLRLWTINFVICIYIYVSGQSTSSSASASFQLEVLLDLHLYPTTFQSMLQLSAFMLQSMIMHVILSNYIISKYHTALGIYVLEHDHACHIHLRFKYHTTAFGIYVSEYDHAYHIHLRFKVSYSSRHLRFRV